MEVFRVFGSETFSTYAREMFTNSSVLCEVVPKLVRELEELVTIFAFVLYVQMTTLMFE